MSIKDDLEKVYGRKSKISPSDVVEWARSHPGSALHKAFGKAWDDDHAAEQHRLHVARQLIANYRITVVGGDEKERRVRAVVSLVEERSPGARSYSHRGQVLSSEERTEKMRRQCADEIRSISERYADVLGGDQIGELERIAGEIGGEAYAA